MAKQSGFALLGSCCGKGSPSADRPNQRTRRPEHGVNVRRRLRGFTDGVACYQARPWGHQKGNIKACSLQRLSACRQVPKHSATQSKNDNLEKHNNHETMD
jgi:hypothetical protein